MNINTMSIVVGGTKCNASCPFCVARMTPTMGTPEKPDAPKWGNLPAAIKYAEQAGASTFLLTSKGEPTLWPDLVTDTLMRLQDSKVAFREMQTNAIPIVMGSKRDPKHPKWGAALDAWKTLGLNTLAVSIVSPHDFQNQQVYAPGGLYPPLKETIKFLRECGFNVRLSCIMVKGYTDTIEKVEKLVNFARENDAFQVTLIPVTKPGHAEDPEAYAYVSENQVPELAVQLRDHFDKVGNRLLVMPHGAVVFDYEGQNVCVSNCLTETTDPTKIRQLIYFTHDGSLRYSWQYAGARIL